jgi:hypothetical protein
MQAPRAQGPGGCCLAPTLLTATRHDPFRPSVTRNRAIAKATKGWTRDVSRVCVSALRVCVTAEVVVDTLFFKALADLVQQFSGRLSEAIFELVE